MSKTKGIVLITGASSGIGRACSHLFAQNNYDLILLARRKDKLDKVVKSILSSCSVNITSIIADVRNYDQCHELLNNLSPSNKAIDILINNAGLAKGFGPINEGYLDHWNAMIDTNIKGLLHISRIVTPWMVSRKSGQVINIASIAGKEVYPNGNVYCATKHAVDALTKAMRIDLVNHNIRVGQVCPGHVEETEFAEVRFDGDKQKAKIYQDFIPINSSDVADIIYFMCSRPSHVNIQDLLVMGTQQASATIINRSGRGSE